jgi:hypothetical protein
MTAPRNASCRIVSHRVASRLPASLRAFLAGYGELPPLSTQTLAGRDPLLEKLKEHHGEKDTS